MVIIMSEKTCDHCKSCCNLIETDHAGYEHAEHLDEPGHVFEKHFWKFMVASGTFLALSLLIEFNIILITIPIWELLLSQGFAILSVVLSCHDVAKAAYNEIKGKRLGASTLMVVAAIGSLLILHGQEGAMAIFLYSLAEKMEDISADKARNAVSKLIELTPDIAQKKTDYGFQEIPTSDIRKGDILIIKPGSKVPLDGTIIEGSSYFDTHAITGESVPRFKEAGDMVYASSINGDRLVEIEVINESGDTLLARITESIKEAQKNKSDTEKFIQKFAYYYTPAIFMISLMVMMVPWLFFAQAPIPWIYRGLILLVISCPCALTLSTPLSMVAALTKLSREGILVKGGKYIEKLGNVEIFGFDKTATLTEGKLKIHDNVPYADGFSPDENLQIITSLEINSDHPIAKAIINSAGVTQYLGVADFEEVKGKGIKGKIDGQQYYIGSTKFFDELGIPYPKDELEEYTFVGKTPVLLGTPTQYLGMVTIRDNLRVSAPILLRGLKKRNIKTMIISGDTQSTTDSIADCLYIDKRFGNLLPKQKLEKIEELQSQGKKVAMVGDGINDAPALSQADVGIAMGSSGTDIALEAADITIMNDDLTKILALLDIKGIANRIIRQNIWMSIIIKVTFAVLTVLGFMNLAIAVGIGDMGVSLLVILNGFRVFNYKSKFQEIKEEDLEVEATSIICDTCRSVESYPQHHGREMVKREGDLVCWKSLVAEVSADACKEKLTLKCPSCNGIRHIE